MVRSCAACGTEWESRSPRARFCSSLCRQRAHGRRKAGFAEAGPVSAGSGSFSGDVGESGSVEEATRAELAAVGRVGSPLGRSALALARRIDGGDGEPGSALAAVAREHRAVLAEAVRNAETAVDPVDELKNRRARKLVAD